MQLQPVRAAFRSPSGRGRKRLHQILQFIDRGDMAARPPILRLYSLCGRRASDDRGARQRLETGVAKLRKDLRAVPMPGVYQASIAGNDLVADALHPTGTRLRRGSSDDEQPHAPLRALFQVGREGVARQAAIHPPARKVPADRDPVRQGHVLELEWLEEVRKARMWTRCCHYGLPSPPFAGR